MYNSVKDCKWLELIHESYIGLEEYSLAIRSKDFFTYYFKTFMSNVKDHFKEFSRSQIKEINNKYSNRLNHTLKDPMIKLGDYILPTPKGMINSYLRTLNDLGRLLQSINADDLLSDTDDLIRYLHHPDKKFRAVDDYTKTNYDKDIKTLSEMFSKNGLVYVEGSFLFSSIKEVNETNRILLDYTETLYPMTIELNKRMKDIEKSYIHLDTQNTNKGEVDQTLLYLAFRVSLFAEILTRLQEVEHNFVECLRILVQTK